MARAALGWGIKDLAEKASVGVNTVSRFEGGKEALVSTAQKIQAALETAGVEFTNGDAPGVRLRPTWEVSH